MRRKNKFPEAEYRAEEIKTLEEKRGALILEMEELIGKAKAEVRAFSEDETKRISEIEKEGEEVMTIGFPPRPVAARPRASGQ